MIIKISTIKDQETGKRFKIMLPIPLFILKTSFVQNLMQKNISENGRQIAQIWPILAGTIIDYKKKYGSWDFIDVKTSDGTFIKIKV